MPDTFRKLPAPEPLKLAAVKLQTESIPEIQGKARTRPIMRFPKIVGGFSRWGCSRPLDVTMITGLTFPLRNSLWYALKARAPEMQKKVSTACAPMYMGRKEMSYLVHCAICIWFSGTIESKLEHFVTFPNELGDRCLKVHSRL